MKAREAFQESMVQSQLFCDVIRKFEQTNEFQPIPGCVVFAIDGKCFSYAFEPADVDKKNHGYSFHTLSDNRSAYLIRKNQVMIVK